MFCRYTDTHCHKTGPFHKEPVAMQTDYVVHNTKWSEHLIYTCPVCGGTKLRLITKDDYDWIAKRL